MIAAGAARTTTDWTPRVDAAGWLVYEWAGEAAYGRLLAGFVGIKWVVPPGGFALHWTPQICGECTGLPPEARRISARRRYPRSPRRRCGGGRGTGNP
jgi:hypothetical protein